MRRVTRNGVFAVAASGALAVGMPAYAAFASGGATADGSAVGSPGAVSGNTVRLPVSVPVNACGNTVDVVGLLNPAAGNACRDDSGRSGGDSGSSSSSSGSSSGASQASSGGASTASGGAVAEGAEQGSPGVLSGNGVRLPVSLPVNVSGNSVNVVGIGNPVIGDQAVNDSGDHPEKPSPRPSAPPNKPTAPARPEGHPRPAPAPAPQAAPPQAASHASLAHTGTDATLPLAGSSAALLLGGIALHRRFRRRAHD